MTIPEAFAEQFNGYGHHRGDVTLIGHCAQRGSTSFATDTFDGAVPIDRVEALFGFDVGYEPLYLAQLDDTGVGYHELRNRQAIVRRDNGTVLNVVSKRHGIHQYADTLLQATSDILDVSGSDIEVAGAGLLDEGGVGWVQFEAPEGVTFGGDTIAPTLTVVTSHNARFATQFRTGLHRFICSNMVGSIHRNVGRSFKVKHTLHSVVRLDDARRALDIMFEATPAMLSEVDRLVNTRVSAAQFEMILEAIVPKPKDDAAQGAVTRWENRTGALRNIYETDERVVEVAGTGWGVVQTFNTWRQWEQPTRSKDGPFGRAMGRFLSGGTETADRRVADVVASVAR